MIQFDYEHELIPSVHQYFSANASLIFFLFFIGYCRADMIVFGKNDNIIAVELKLADWKKALIQAQNYQLAVDYVYLAFPSKKCDLVLKRAEEKLKQNGIGLISVDEETKQVAQILNAKKSTIAFGRLSKRNLINQRKKVYRRKRL